jgi:adenosylcobyric acid synthase
MNRSEKNQARCLAVLGTGSDVGKSIVVTALCRIFSDLGVRVAPFKAQNMSNNSFVTPDGGEMGRAQVVQAEAARAAFHTDMNPVLLKPCADTGAQVVLHGRPVGDLSAAEYFTDTSPLFREAKTSLDRLRAAYDLVVMEGAGSCAEVNLRDRDFVNFRMAHAAEAPVILVADIDRGGVFAQVAGTLAVIPPRDRKQVVGIIINKFRGDPALFRDGIAWVEQHTGLPVLGLIPYFRHIEIDSEDGVPLDLLIDPPLEAGHGKISIAVLRLPHISNFTDFSPFCRDPDVCLHYLVKPRPLNGYDIVFLPGSKNVRADLDWMRRAGWDKRLREYVGRGGRVGGICGGYQMLGTEILDPHGIEGDPGRTEGLRLLDVTTTLGEEKILARVSGIWEATGEEVEGYEIHMGITQRLAGTAYAIRVTSRQGRFIDDIDGAVDSEGRVWGTYVHGLFDLPGFRGAFLKGIDPEYATGVCPATTISQSEFKERQYEMLADHFRSHLDMPTLMDIVSIHDFLKG